MNDNDIKSPAQEPEIKPFVDEHLEEYLRNQHEVEYHNPAFRRELVELLKKHELSALVAVDRLRTFCDEILCHFNTRDLDRFVLPKETQMRIEYARTRKPHGMGWDVSWVEILAAGSGRECQAHHDVSAQLDEDRQ